MSNDDHGISGYMGDQSTWAQPNNGKFMNSLYRTA